MRTIIVPHAWICRCLSHWSQIPHLSFTKTYTVYAYSYWQTREIPLHRITKQISLSDNAEICHICILPNRKIEEAFILKRGSGILTWFSGQCLLKCPGISCFRAIKYISEASYFSWCIQSIRKICQYARNSIRLSGRPVVSYKMIRINMATVVSYKMIRTNIVTVARLSEQ